MKPLYSNFGKDEVIIVKGNEVADFKKVMADETAAKEDAPGFHARFAPSASARWMTCTASIPLVEELMKHARIVESGSSKYADLGTAMHSAGEWVLSDPTREAIPDSIGFVCPDTGITITDSMAEIVEVYVETIRDKLAEEPGSILLLERRFHLHEECSGSVDATILATRKLMIEDLKTGTGHFVDPRHNYQLGIYAAAAYKEFQDFFDFDTISAGIIQPPLNNIKHVIYVPDELKKIEEEVVAVIDQVNEGKTRFMPSEDACRWCPAKPLCPAFNRKTVSRAIEDFANVYNPGEDDTPTSDFEAKFLGADGDDIAKAMDWGDRLELVTMLELWVKSVKEQTTEMLYTDQIPEDDSLAGKFKVVTGRAGNRVYTDDRCHARLARKFKLKKSESMKSTPLGPTGMQTAIKKKVPDLKAKEIKEYVNRYVTCAPGGKTIVPFDDPREALSSTASAVTDFADAE